MLPGSLGWNSPRGYHSYTNSLSFIHKLLSGRERENRWTVYVKVIPPKGGNYIMLSSIRLVPFMP